VKSTFPTSIPPSLIPLVSEQAVITRSPGRINLLGEHTDYNSGFVLPAAIDQAVYFVLTPREDDQLNLFSIDLDEKYSTPVSELKKSGRATWPNYILGVVSEFQKAGFRLRGFDAAFTGEIPIGAGLSSSAALECAVAFALDAVVNGSLPKMELVKMAQQAENNFVGVRCGIMDQFASVFGRADHVIKLDCRSLDFEYLPWPGQGFSLLLFDSKVKHSLASSAYNERRQQCETGLEMIQRKVAGVRSLREVTTELLQQYVLPFDELIFRRCNYVVKENERLQQAAGNLTSGDLFSFGKKMFETHWALSREYEVSCAELDFLVNAVQDKKEVLGARMMGGGFGGCTINLVKEESVEKLTAEISHAYESAMKKPLRTYRVKLDNGTSVLSHR
jgi:galactokinase